MSKFQSYKNWINEKFKEESDPVRDMGIGIYHPAKYKTPERAARFVVKHLTTIMGVDKLPSDIINKYNPDVVNVFNNAYWPSVKGFLMKCVLTSDGRRELSFWSSVLKDMFQLLHAMGYPKDVNEAFTEESDPIEDMGIGMLSQIKKYLKEEGYEGDIVHNRTNANIALDLFKDNAKYEFFKFLIKNSDLFDITPDDLITSLQISGMHKNWKAGKILIKNGTDLDKAIEDAKNRGFGTTATRLVLLKNNLESIDINEKFSEDSDPIQDMGIGANEFIKSLKWGITDEYLARIMRKPYFDLIKYGDYYILIFEDESHGSHEWVAITDSGGANEYDYLLSRSRQNKNAVIRKIKTKIKRVMSKIK